MDVLVGETEWRFKVEDIRLSHGVSEVISGSVSWSCA